MVEWVTNALQTRPIGVISKNVKEKTDAITTRPFLIVVLRMFGG